MTARRVIYVIGTAAPPILQISEACQLLIHAGWNACVILTPNAAGWVSIDEIAETTGCTVRVQPRLPGEKDSLPEANAVLAAPLTFNSLNKWAAGISDNLALGLLNELMGANVPISAAPCVKTALREHPAYSASLALLRKCGVRVLEQDQYIARTQTGLAAFDWASVIESGLNTPDKGVKPSRSHE